MKKFAKSVSGVTLLEVMLVLAIAAMIIVMSVRYYQSASASNQVNTTIGEITNIVASADSLAQATGKYNSGGSNSVSIANLRPLVPAGSLTTPWGTDFTITGVAASSYTVNAINVPSNVCPLLRGKLLANNHFTVSACTANAVTPTLAITYTANP